MFEGELTWLSLLSFVENLPPDSALVREIGGDTARWMSGDMTAFILADIADILQALLYQHALAHTDPKKQKPPKPKPYKRPNQKKKKARGAQSFGSGGIPVTEFKRWWDTH